MKLAKYLADYLTGRRNEITRVHRSGGTTVWDTVKCKELIQAGIEAFCSTEDSIVVVSKLNISTGRINEVERYDY